VFRCNQRKKESREEFLCKFKSDINKTPSLEEFPGIFLFSSLVTTEKVSGSNQNIVTTAKTVFFFTLTRALARMERAPHYFLPHLDDTNSLSCSRCRRNQSNSECGKFLASQTNKLRERETLRAEKKNY